MKLRVRACIAIALVLHAPGASAQAPDFTALDAVVQQELKETGVPGATVAIVSGGRVIYTKGYGTANVETNAPMTPDLLFRLGSTTKMPPSLPAPLPAQTKLRVVRSSLGTV